MQCTVQRTVGNICHKNTGAEQAPEFCGCRETGGTWRSQVVQVGQFALDGRPGGHAVTIDA